MINDLSMLYDMIKIILNDGTEKYFRFKNEVSVFFTLHALRGDVKFAGLERSIKVRTADGTEIINIKDVKDCKLMDD